MSIWAEIKHSINSNLDKPLDVLINGSKGLKKSDNLYTLLYPDILKLEKNGKLNVPIKVIINWSGSFTLKGTLYTSDNLKQFASLEIYKNGSLFKKIIGHLSDSDDKTFSEDFTCSENDIFTFVLLNETKSVSNPDISYLYNLGIYAELFDMSGVTIEEI